MKKQISYLAFLSLLSCTQPATKEESSHYSFVLDEDSSAFRERYLAADESNTIAKKNEIPTDSSSYTYFSSIARNYLIDGKPYEALDYVNRGFKVVKNKARYYLDKSSVWALVPSKNASDSMYFFLNLAIATNPKDPYYYFILSRHLNESGRNKEALENINKAIRLMPTEKSFINQRGIYEVAEGNFRDAILDLKEVSPANINNFEFYTFQSIAYNQLEMHAEALAAAENMLLLDSSYSNAYVIKGTALHYLHRERESRLAFDKAASLGDSTAIKYVKRFEKKGKNK